MAKKRAFSTSYGKAGGGSVSRLAAYKKKAPAKKSSGASHHGKPIKLLSAKYWDSVLK